MDTVLDLILVHFFHIDDLIGVKMLFFGVDNSSSVHVDNKKIYILVLGEGIAQGLDGTTKKAEASYSSNFPRSQKNFCLSLHCNRSNSFLFVNATKNI